MIEVLIVDDHAIFRSGVRRLLADEPDMRVVAEAANGGEALARLRERRYDAVLLDINMSGRSGLEMLAHLRAEWPRQPVIMLSMYPEDQYAVLALKAGAQAYLSKDMAADEMVAAIRVVADGRRYISPATAAKLLDQPEAGCAPHLQLSPRELHVLRLIARGHSLTAIGEEIFLSVKTVSTYKTRILAKLGLSSNAELVRYALTQGLVD
jgi:DNA-binding NarL/FixJ family response regulator